MAKPNVWKAKNEEIARLKAEIAELRSRPMKLEFWGQVGHAITLMMAQTPYSKWPTEYRTAFDHVARLYTTSGYLIREELKSRETRKENQ